MPTRSRMSLIMGQIEPENPDLFALEFGKIAEYDCLLSYHLQISTNQHQTYVHDHKISDEFDYGTNRTETVRVVWS